MKRCPRCGQTYNESDINFCLNDGELLSRIADEPPTVVMDRARTTNQTNWDTQYAPPAAWPGNQQQQVTPPAFGQMQAFSSPNQSLAIISLSLGISGLVIGWCCSLGLLLSPGAMITGLIALSQIKKDPSKYGGRGFAIAGIVSGAIFLAVYILFIIIYGIAIIGGNIG